jgi:hypothetical protein
MAGDLGGYEWGYTCPECEEFHDLSGMAVAASRATVNGEEDAFRVRALEPGDTVECAECGHTIELAFLDPERPDNLERAIDLLRRQHYGEVADWLEDNL